MLSAFKGCRSWSSGIGTLSLFGVENRRIESSLRGLGLSAVEIQNKLNRDFKVKTSLPTHSLKILILHEDILAEVMSLHIKFWGMQFGIGGIVKGVTF